MNVSTEHSELMIHANDAMTRSYEVANPGISTQFELTPRSSRWNGSIGLYRASGNNQVHAVLEEGHQYFADESEALDWIRWSGGLEKVYTSNGLLVEWNVDENPNDAGPSHALTVNVWQIFVDEEKPEDLRGADDSAFEISYRNSKCDDERKPSGHQVSEPKEIEGRQFSGRALGIMKEKGISVGRVLSAIEHGEQFRGGGGLQGYLFDAPDGGLVWVAVDSTGAVRLVGG